MTAETYLRQYAFLKDKNQATLWEIEILRAEAEKVVPLLNPDKVQTTLPEHKNEDLIFKIAQLWDKYNSEMALAFKIMDEIKENVYSATPSKAETLFLHYVKGMSLKEIAYEVQKSYNAVQLEKKYGLREVQENLLLYPQNYTDVTTIND